MKRLLFIILTFISVQSFGQHTQIVQGAAASTSTALKTATTTALQAATRSGKTTAIVTDAGSGGTFNYSTETLTDDYGITFPATGGGHWVRDVSQSMYVHANWFGIKPTNTASENTILITAMLAAVPRFSVIFWDLGVYHYNGMVITKTVNFKGAAKYGSQLVNDSTGDAVTIIYDGSNGNERTFFEDIAIFGNGAVPYGATSTSGNGIVLNGAVNLDFHRVWLRGHRNGFYSDSAGNVNNINIYFCDIEWNKQAGIHIYQRSYANQQNSIYIQNCNITSNGHNNVELWGSSITLERSTLQDTRGYAVTVDGNMGFLPSIAKAISIRDNYYELCDSGFALVKGVDKATGSRYVYGITITGNYGVYNRNGKPIDGRSLAIVDIDQPGWFSFNNQRVTGLVYQGNAFAPGSPTLDSLTIPIVFNGHGHLGNDCIVQKSLLLSADVSATLYQGLGMATVTPGGLLTGTGHPNNNYYGFPGSIFLRKDSLNLSTGYNFYVKKGRGSGLQFYQTDAVGWYPLVDSAQVNAIVSPKQDQVDHHSYLSQDVASIVTTAPSGAIPYFGSDKQMKFNTSQLHWDSTNNRLGIGTVAPNFPFELRGNGSHTTGTIPLHSINVRTTDTPAAGFGFSTVDYMQDNTSPDQPMAQTDYTWLDATHGSQRGRITEYLMAPSVGGRVAIRKDLQSDLTNVFVGINTGTLAVDSALTVGNSTQGGLHLRKIYSSNSASDSMLTINSSGGVNMRSMPWGITGNSITAGSQFLGSTNNVSLRFRTNNTEVMVADSVGNVGIGVAAPSNRLSIALSSTSGTTVADGNVINVYNPNTTDNNLSGIWLGSTNGNSTLQGVGLVGRQVSHSAGARGADLLFYTSTSNASSQVAIMTGSGRFGLGVGVPTQTLHIKAPTSAANTGQIKLDAGIRPSTSIDGLINYDTASGNHQLTVGMSTTDNSFTATSYVLPRVLQVSGTLDFTSTSAQSSSDLTLTVTGAALNDEVSVGTPNGSVLSNSAFTAWVSAANTVTVRFNNYSSGSQDPASGTFRVSVIKH